MSDRLYHWTAQAAHTSALTSYRDIDVPWKSGRNFQDTADLVDGRQSNMIGYGTRTADLTPQQRQPQRNVKIIADDKTGWLELAPGLGPHGSSFGPELAVGRHMADALPDAEVLLVKARFGLGNLYNDWRSPNTGRGPAGPHYARFITLVKKAIARKPDAKITGMVWMQGEGDGYDDINKAKDYAKNLRLFIDSIRADLKSPDMRWLQPPNRVKLRRLG